MGLIQESDVGNILRDQALMDEIVAGLVKDSGIMEQMAEEIAEQVQSALEDDSDMRLRMVNAAVSNDAFKQKLIAKLVDELQSD